MIRWCDNCGAKLKSHQKGHKCVTCKAKARERYERERQQELKGRPLYLSKYGLERCPFGGNCVDIQGLDKFLRQRIQGLRPAATHRSDASRDHRSPGARQ